MTEEMKNVNIEETEELEDVYVTLEFEDGNEEECRLLAVFDNEEKLYAALDPEDGTNELYFFQYIEVDDDSFELADIETEEEFNAVADLFFELMEEEEEK